ncbi:MAG TPA: DNA polymerase III subunit gamma/tau [Candidatus Limnocylindrales bacterium]|nr:DNA polymerase III subunit gamma/tau [Candidatus Limnocylindrales bacterium]
MTQPAPHQAIYRRWRAQTFGQIVGQEAVVETLRNAVRTGRVAHAILFVGPRGTGKTSLARIMAKALNCTNLRDGDPCDVCEACVAIREGRAMDLVEIDAASNRGIDAIRELRERINYAPTDLRRKVYILDEAHQITRDAWNALLKSLEEPPEFVTFMFASTHPEEFPPAILSRLQRFDVRRLTTGEIEGKLSRILEADGRTATPEALHLIARLAAGGMRDAESMLDQLLASSPDVLDEARVRDLLGLADGESISAFVAALVDGDVLSGLRILDALEERGRDLRGFLDQVVEAIRAAMVGTSTEPAVARHPLVDLTAAARRLAAIDPTRAGVGGLRLQLDLALFPDAATVSEAAPLSRLPAAERPAALPTPPVPASRSRAAATARDRGVRTSADASDLVPEPPDSGPVAGGPAAAGPGDGGPATVRAVPAPDANATPTSPAPGAAPTTAAPTTAAPTTAALPGPPVGGELAVLRDRWPEVVLRISAHPPTKPLIAKCRPISVEGEVVTLGFPEDQAFLRSVADRRRSVLEEGIAAVLGHPVAVRCVATNLDLVPEVATDDAAFVLAQARRIFGDDAADRGEVG